MNLNKKHIQQLKNENSYGSRQILQKLKLNQDLIRKENFNLAVSFVKELEESLLFQIRPFMNQNYQTFVIKLDGVLNDLYDMFVEEVENYNTIEYQGLLENNIEETIVVKKDILIKIENIKALFDEETQWVLKYSRNSFSHPRLTKYAVSLKKDKDSNFFYLDTDIYSRVVSWATIERQHYNVMLALDICRTNIECIKELRETLYRIRPLYGLRQI